MASIQSIIAATDFSEEARYGAERAGIVAREQWARLDLLHVISRSSLDALGTVFRVPADVEADRVDYARSTLNELSAHIFPHHHHHRSGVSHPVRGPSPDCRRAWRSHSETL